MQRVTFSLENYKQKGAPHKLAYEAERLCNEIKIPFNTILLRAIKTNYRIAEETIAYMKDRRISSINYFTKVFYAKVKLSGMSKTNEQKGRGIFPLPVRDSLLRSTPTQTESMGEGDNKPKKGWLCQSCSQGVKPFTLAGMELSCAKCGQYAYGYYEIGDKIEPAIIFNIHES